MSFTVICIGSRCTRTLVTSNTSSVHLGKKPLSTALGALLNLTKSPTLMFTFLGLIVLPCSCCIHKGISFCLLVAAVGVIPPMPRCCDLLYAATSFCKTLTHLCVALCVKKCHILSLSVRL